MLTARYRGCVGDARRRYRGDRPGYHGLLRQLGHGSWRIQRGRPVECSQRTLHSPYRRRRIRSDSTHQYPSFRRLPAAIADLCSRTQQLSASSDRQECPVSQHGPGLGRPWGLLNYSVPTFHCRRSGGHSSTLCSSLSCSAHPGFWFRIGCRWNLSPPSRSSCSFC